MQVAAPTRNEHARLALLKALALLDSPPEELFDRITRIAARVLDVPIVAISLIDRDRQWFKSCVGLDATETPRDIAFCAHAIHQSEPLIVPDATADVRFADNPLVSGDPNIRFYAGAPIFSSRGIALGTLCAIDRRPRVFDAAQIQLLLDLTELVHHEIVRRETALLSRTVIDASVRAVADSEQEFKAVFEQAPVGIAKIALDGRWLQVNPKMCEITGFSFVELMSEFSSVNHHPSDEHIGRDRDYQLLRGEMSSYSIEKRILRKDGSSLWINSTVALLRDSAGDAVHFITFCEDIQARKDTESELFELHFELELRVEQRTAELQAVLDNSVDAVAMVDSNGLVTRWNTQAESVFGWLEHEIVGLSLIDTIIPHEAYEQAKTDEAHLLATRELQTELVPDADLQRRDGSRFSAEIANSKFADLKNSGYCVFIRDISARKFTELQLRRSEARMQQIANSLPVCIAYVDAEYNVMFVNEAYRTHFNIDPNDMINQSIYQAIPAEAREIIRPRFEAALRGERIQFEVSLKVHGNITYWEAHYLPDTQDGVVRGFHAMMYDITASKLLAESLQRDATRDELTRLPNRRGLLENLTAAIARAERSGLALGILFLDLDAFKQINDNYGHQAGDQVLIDFAQRLQQCVRNTDTVARLAGDEFIVVLEALQHADTDVAAVGQKIIRAMNEPFDLNGKSIVLSTSIGAHIHNAGIQKSPEELLSAADQAMYTAKKRGKNQINVA